LNPSIPNYLLIQFAIAFFFGAGVFCEQIVCLMFRYTAIQQKYDNLNKNFRSNNTRVFLFILGTFVKTLAAYLAYNSMASPEVYKLGIIFTTGGLQYLYQKR
jgi:O-antigen/teichoic acid export membrane protein